MGICLLGEVVGRSLMIANMEIEKGWRRRRRGRRYRKRRTRLKIAITALVSKWLHQQEHRHPALIGSRGLGEPEEQLFFLADARTWDSKRSGR